MEKGVFRASSHPYEVNAPIRNRFDLLEDELSSPYLKENLPQMHHQELGEINDGTKTRHIKKTDCDASDKEANIDGSLSDKLPNESINNNDAESSETNDSLDENKMRYLINMTGLMPENLFVIEVHIGDQTVEALLDTGASNCFMKKSLCEKLNLEPDSQNSIITKGIGYKNIRTLGEVSTDFSFYGMKSSYKIFQVVNDDVIEFPMILSWKFCQHHKLIINVGKRKISMCYDDVSRTDIYINKDNNKLRKIVFENIKVFAQDNLQIKSGLNKVPINLESSFRNEENVRICYSGACKNPYLEGIDGILDSEEENKFVFLKIKDVAKKDKVKIKKGDVVGLVCTIVELDSADESQESWDVNDLKNKMDMGVLSEEEKEQVFQMVGKVKEAFGKNEYDIGLANVSPHKIQITDETPIWQKPRRYADPINCEIAEQCQELEMLDIIEKCTSDWSSPVVPVRKSDGGLRMCVDYRKVNKVTKQENFPMPHLADSIYSAHNIKYFTKVDLIKGYYQVPIHPDSRQYTSFSTVNEQYQFKRLSFGLRNSGIQFQRNMQEILTEFKSKRVIVYQDDILIMSEDFQDHINLVERVLTTLMKNGVKIKLSKCEFFKQKVTFLGHLISSEGIQKSPEFIDKILNYPKPKTVTELRQFLGLANFQRKFIGNFSVIAKPLSSLTGGPKRQQLVWNSEMETAFETLKSKLSQEVKLSFPDYNKNASPLELYVDASGLGAGACLIQKQNGEFKGTIPAIFVIF